MLIFAVGVNGLKSFRQIPAESVGMYVCIMLLNNSFDINIEYFTLGSYIKRIKYILCRCRDVRKESSLSSVT